MPQNNIKSKNKSKKKSKKNYNNTVSKSIKCKRSAKYKNKNLIGGEKLGEGSFGCVITPPISCRNDSIKSTKYISKIIKANNKRDYEDTMHEIRLSSLFKKIDPESKYFTFIFDYCEIKKPVVRSDFKLLNTELVNRSNNMKSKNFCYTTKKDKTYNLIQKNAGYNLDDILVYSKYNKERQIINSRFKSIVRHLIIGLRKCHKLEIIHHDIKADNMGIRIEGNNPYVTYFDFGLSEDIKKLDTKSYQEISTSVYGTPGFISPDMNVISKIIKYLYKNEFSSLVSGSKRKKLIMKILEEIKEDEYSIHIKKLNLNKSSLKIKSSTKSNKNTDKSKSKTNKSKTNRRKSNTKEINNKEEVLVDYQETEELYDLFIELIYKGKLLPLFYQKYSGIKYKYDIYSLGITFFKIAKYCKYDNNNFLDLIRNMIHYNPIKRYDINQCMNHPFISPNKK